MRLGPARSSPGLDKFDRIFQLHSILANRRTPLDVESLMARLECSRATLFRIIGSMRDHLGAPVEFDAGARRVHLSPNVGRRDVRAAGIVVLAGGAAVARGDAEDS